MSYEANFIESNKRRRLLNLPPLKIEILNNRWLDYGNADKLSLYLKNITEQFTPEEFRGQCISIHVELLEYIKEYFNSLVYFTIGYFIINGKPSYKFNEQDIIRWVQEGMPNYPQLDIHAWITLPTLEILDFTLLTTLSFTMKEPKLLGGVISKHYSDLNFSYFPMIIGEDCLFPIGAAKPHFYF